MGSLQASLLAFGYTPGEVAHVYEKFVTRFFAYTLLDCGVIAAKKAFFFGSCEHDGATGGYYRSENIITAVEALLGDHPIADVRKRLVTGFSSLYFLTPLSYCQRLCSPTICFLSVQPHALISSITSLCPDICYLHSVAERGG